MNETEPPWAPAKPSRTTSSAKAPSDIARTAARDKAILVVVFILKDSCPDYGADAQGKSADHADSVKISKKAPVRRRRIYAGWVGIPENSCFLCEGERHFGRPAAAGRTRLKNR